MKPGYRTFFYFSAAMDKDRDRDMDYGCLDSLFFVVVVVVVPFPASLVAC